MRFYNNRYPVREEGPFQVLYMEDTPMLVDYVSQIGVIVISIDDMVIPGKLVKPILDEIMRDHYKVRVLKIMNVSHSYAILLNAKHE